jgi:DNA polymerase-3 subunit delta
MVIILTGADTYRSLQRLRQLREAFTQKHDPQGLGAVVLDGDSINEEDVRNALGSGGLFSKHRLVVIDPYRSAKSSLKPTGLSAAAVLIVKDQETILIIREVAEAPTTKRGSRAGKAAVALKIPGAKVEEFPAMDVGTCERWVAAEVKKLGGQINTAVARCLVSATGPDTWRLHNEIDKLLAYATGRSITDKDVEELVMDKVESDIFRLTDAVGNNRRAEALRCLRHELEAGVNPLAILAMLERHVGGLLQIAKLKPESSAAAARELGMHPYVAQKSFSQAKTIGYDRLRSWYRRLINIDRDLKSTALEAETLLGLFLMRD